MRRITSQLLSSIKAGGYDRGFWLKLPCTSLAWSSQLQYGQSGEPGGKAQDSRQKGRLRMKVVKVETLGLLEKEEGGKGASNGQHDVLIPRQSGGRPVCVPCLMRRSQFPDAGLLSGRLLNIFNKPLGSNL